MIPLPSPPVQSGQPGPDQIQGTRRIVSVMGTVFTVDLRDLGPGAPAVDTPARARSIKSTARFMNPPGQEQRRCIESHFRVFDPPPPSAPYSPVIAHFVQIPSSADYFPSFSFLSDRRNCFSRQPPEHFPVQIQRLTQTAPSRTKEFGPGSSLTRDR